ncbi:uncharacterized protein LOC127103020 [Lathyrus oleraceus]|uniref:uncharacterized protein LOC127103020 n=1 Tax=Pisum sativum TaxID=3888 RepID=UPI0021D2BAA4|nr:uncharacterized protein LOC127103020 [Pisum sativum]
MSQHQTTLTSKTTKSTQKVSAPSMDFHDDEILDVVPLSVIPCEALDLNHPMDALASACPNQGHSMKRVSTPLSKMYPSPEVEQHSKKNDNSSSYEKDMVAEGLCSLGKTVSGKGKSVASKTANASRSEKHDVANDVIDLEDDRTAKKAAGVGPSKSWSKVEMKKSKVREVSESEEDVEEDVPDISLVKKSPMKKSPMKVVAMHLDNVSFHLEDGAAKWKFVIQRRVVVARELEKDVVEVKEVMDLINSVGLIKTVAGRVEGARELEAIDNEVFREITARQVKGWPIKKHLPDEKLTVKYAILHKIGAANWMPTNHISTIANTLGRFIFAVGTKINFDYGRFMFEQIIKHTSTNAVKLPIAFTSMICGIILNQHPGILSSNDLPSRRKPDLSVHYKLFEGSHVEDIVKTFAMKNPASKVGTILELKETCKELGEGIRIATARKESLEALIASLDQAEGENIGHAKEAEAHTSSETSANNDETSGNSISNADEAASSSSSDYLL